MHGHFYRPPRENPWLEAVELQDSAYPYHDWNERITAECYAPNAASRILNPDGRIAKVANNYSETHQAIVNGDRESLERHSGHGSAIAQAYSHMIMPLANSRDKATQIVWGIRNFEYRFGRVPEGMWLHDRHGEMALTYAIDHLQSKDLAEIAIYGRYLQEHPPTHEVEIFENSSWSCAHGVERWRSNCGCNSWRGTFPIPRIGRYLYRVEGWIDRFATWRANMAERIRSGQDVQVECVIGAGLLEDSASRASTEDAVRLRRWAAALRDLEDRWPVRRLTPVVHPGDPDWRDYYGSLNAPHCYHNGGAWPFLGGFYVAALVKAGRNSAAEDALLRLDELNRAGRFNQWHHGDTGLPMGVADQAWSARMCLFARECVRRGRVEVPF